MAGEVACPKASLSLRQHPRDEGIPGEARRGFGGSSPASEVGWETKHRPQNAKCRSFPLGKGGRWVCPGVCHCDRSAALGLLMASQGLVVGARPQHHCKHPRWRVGQSLRPPPKHPLCRSLAAEERSPLAFWKAGHSTAASQRGAEAGSGQEMCRKPGDPMDLVTWPRQAEGTMDVWTD